MLIVILAFGISALGHGYLQTCAPSNAIVALVRRERPRPLVAASAFAFSLALACSAGVLADWVASGAPGWLNVIVFIAIWDAFKFTFLGLAVALGCGRAWHDGATQRGGGQLRARLRRPGGGYTYSSNMRLQASTTSTRDLLGQFMTTPWVADVMAASIDCRGPWRILDPACGDGNLLMAAVHEARRRGIEIERIIGYDVDADLLGAAAARLGEIMDPALVDLRHRDFLTALDPDLGGVNVVLSNPPYGRSREYLFFEHCAELHGASQLIFLVPLSFLDRVSGVSTAALPGRPLGVTTGHAIVTLKPGGTYGIRPTREPQILGGDFQVLTGAKLYERGAGSPPQTEEIVGKRAYSSTKPIPGWLPCARTGDVTPEGVVLNRLWVSYGDHLAHPKDLDRFTGPRVFVRRVPIWKDRQLGAAYIDTPALAAGDLLIAKHKHDDPVALVKLQEFLNSPNAASAMHKRRPSLILRDSFPKFSAKDLTWLIREYEASR